MYFIIYKLILCFIRIPEIVKFCQKAIRDSLCSQLPIKRGREAPEVHFYWLQKNSNLLVKNNQLMDCKPTAMAP